jgi:hypothetical protein
MARHGDRSSGLVVKRPLPVAPTPLGCPSGVDRDDPQPGVGGHADQQIPERAGGDLADGAAKPLAAPAPPKLLPAGLAGLGEVEVLDGDGAAAVRLGEPDDGGDGFRSLAWRVLAGSRSRSRAIVAGSPTGLPLGSSTQVSTWAALRSTATVRCWRSSSSDGTGLLGSRQEASAYQRRLAGSKKGAERGPQPAHASRQGVGGVCRPRPGPAGRGRSPLSLGVVPGHVWAWCGLDWLVNGRVSGPGGCGSVRLPVIMWVSEPMAPVDCRACLLIISELLRLPVG